ncbi:MAG: prolyl oligopeptidase family serine peptidase [Actinomycetota bacterium]|nr:prolyl oligopeptidase family serine peptidase [Actinomycetota bacterium]
MDVGEDLPRLLQGDDGGDTPHPGGTPDGTVHKIAALATPRTCLLPRLPGEGWQLLAVTGFEEVTALLRIDWAEGTWSEAGRLPALVDGGLWLDAGRQLALNVLGPSGRASVYAVDLEAGQFSPFFEVSADSDDRAVLLDPETRHLVVTTDAPGWPAVGVARLPGVRGVPEGTGVRGVPEGTGVRGVPEDSADGIRLLPALPEGDEGARPCGFVGPPEARQLLLHHEVGSFVRLRTADLATLEVSEPLPVPDGEVGRVVATDGTTVRLAFSAPDLPCRPARLHLPSGRFHVDLEPAADGGGHASLPCHPGRQVTFPGPSGPMPALVLDPAGAGDLVVVALHGGPIARWGAEYHAELQLFAALGLRVVALDYPGSTGWGRPYLNSLLGTAGALDVEAVASVVDGLGAAQVLLYGESYGAFLAMAVACVRPVAGVVAFAPFKSFVSLKEHGSPEVRGTLELLEAGNSDKPGRNLLKGCRTIRSKVLIAHGTADLTIPVGESRELVRALRDERDAGDEEVRLVELEGQGHDLVGRDVLEHWYRELAGFTGEHSRSGSPAQRETSSRGAEQAASSTTTGREVEPHVRAHQFGGRDRRGHWPAP